MENQNNKPTFVRPNITTNSLTFFDENGVMLKLAFFDETYSVVLCAPIVNGEGKKTYPAEARENFIITAERVQALHDNIIMDKVLPAISEKRNYNGGIFLNSKKDRVFEIRVQGDDLYAIYYKDIDFNDRRPKKTVVFKFVKVPIIEKYNPESGEFEMVDTYAQFLLFTKTLEGFLMCINNITAHSFKYSNKQMIDRMFNYLKEMAVKLGIPIDASLAGGPFRGGGGSTFNNQNNDDSSFPVMTEASDLSSMLIQ